MATFPRMAQYFGRELFDFDRVVHLHGFLHGSVEYWNRVMLLITIVYSHDSLSCVFPSTISHHERMQIYI